MIQRRMFLGLEGVGLTKKIVGSETKDFRQPGVGE